MMITFLDLFAGAGGLSEGFIRAGFKPIAHIESDLAASNTLLTRIAYHYLNSSEKSGIYTNYLSGSSITRYKLHMLLPEELKSSCINIEINNENNKIIFKSIDYLRDGEKIDVIIGGPPCQAYSLPGRSRDKNKMIGDSRNFLYIQYAKYLKKFKPEIFVFENVTGLLSAKNKDGSSYLIDMVNVFRDAGYATEVKVLNAKDFGVLQNRKRVILIGRKGNKKGFYPSFNMTYPNTIVKDLFVDLPKIKAGEGSNYCVPYLIGTNSYLSESYIRNGLNFTTQHIARPHTEQDKEIYRIAVEKWNSRGERLNYNDLPENLKTHKNRKSFTDRFKVVADNLPFSQTIVAHISKDGHYYIHPDILQNRSLTPREAARLQSFPDDYYFEGINEKPNRTAAFKQIGNAVPPLMAQKIACAIKNMFL